MLGDPVVFDPLALRVNTFLTMVGVKITFTVIGPCDFVIFFDYIR